MVDHIAGPFSQAAYIIQASQPCKFNKLSFAKQNVTALVMSHHFYTRLIFVSFNFLWIPWVFLSAKLLNFIYHEYAHSGRHQPPLRKIATTQIK